MQDVVMRFKVHRVKELYPDLQKYSDSRDELDQFTILAPAISIEYALFVESLVPFGYIKGALLYYLSPVPGSEPQTGLLSIDGPDEVRQMVSAHVEQGTKICHLYLVSDSDGGTDADSPVDDWSP